MNLTPTQISTHEARKARHRTWAERAADQRYAEAEAIAEAEARKPVIIQIRPDAREHMKDWRAWNALINPHSLPMDHVKALCHFAGITYDTLTSASRTRPLVAIRHRMIRDTAEKYPNLSSSKLGRIFKRDHTVIIYCSGRHGGRGPTHAAKLTHDQVREIRRRWDTGQELSRVIAADYGLATGTIGKIGARRTWRHVD